MEKPKQDWKTFSLRRRLDVKAWLESLNIKDYHGLATWCASKDMTPPEKKEMVEYFQKKMKPAEVKLEVEVEAAEEAKSEILVPKPEVEVETKPVKRGRPSRKKLDKQE